MFLQLIYQQKKGPVKRQEEGAWRNSGEDSFVLCHTVGGFK